jgi:ADP-heptose:LPS heptosyltransferase
LKKILIIRFSSIGDIVLTTPVVRALKEQSGAEVHYLTKAAFKSILEPNPHIDRVFTIKKKVSEALPELKKERYDCIVDLHKNLRSAQVRLGLGVRAYAFDKLNIEKWLLVRFGVNRLPDVHIVDRYLATAAPLGVKNDGKGLDYFIPHEDEVDVEEFLGTASPYIAFAIGAAHATKRLPAGKIISICKKIPLPVVLLGGPEDKEEGERIAREAGPHVVNACGALRLNQSASLVRQAWKVISHDTGMMHIAAAFGKDIISVWGNTIPEFGMYPYYPQGLDRNTTFEVKGLPCRPCSKIGYAKCPKGHFRCMEEIDEEGIVDLLME